MSRLFPLSLLLLALLPSLGCETTSQVAADASQDSLAIHSLLLDAADKAYSGDLDGYLSHRTLDALSVADHLRDPLTLEGTREMYRDLLAGNDWRPITPMVVNDLWVSGSLGFACLTFATEITPKNGTPPVRQYSRHFTILRKQADGSWKVARDMWSNVPYDGG